MDFPFIISLPHCSGRIPEAIRAHFALSDEEIHESIDLGTMEIFGSLPVKSVVSALWSRLVVDLNRGADERDPGGVIAERDYRGRRVYRQGLFPDDGEVENRLRDYYRPYHKRLTAALEHGGPAFLFDCHSLYGVGPAGAPDPGRRREDIILGNNGNGRGEDEPFLGALTCPPRILHRIKAAFQKSGFTVSLNNPYSGGFITTHYGHRFAAWGLMAVQIEINQELFADGIRPRPDRLREVKRAVHEAFREMLRTTCPGS